MKLSEKHRPRALGEIVGQEAARELLEAWQENPYASCWLFVGTGGIGKTSSAIALALELGCQDPAIVNCADFGIDAAKRAISGLHYRPMSGSRWNVLIVEELERLSPACQVWLKTALDTGDFPRHAIVIATSNCVDAIDGALLQRFTSLEFDCGSRFRAAAVEHLRIVWSEESNGVALPVGWQEWGVTGGGKGYSLRVALDRMQTALLLVSARSKRQPAAVALVAEKSTCKVDSVLRPIDLVRKWKGEGFKAVRFEGGRCWPLLAKSADSYDLSQPDTVDVIADEMRT